jgi:S1-C subfamily serine protease
MTLRKLFLWTMGVVAGFAGGLVVSGRLSATQDGSASPAPRASAAHQSSQSSGSGAANIAATGMPDLSPIAERAIQASVNISSTVNLPTNNWYRAMGGDDLVPQTSLGSGVIVSADGYVLTNSHVAQNTNAAITVTLPDNRALPAKVIGIDAPSDLALLKVAATGLNPLPWGDSSKLRVAQWVLAVGNPYEFSQTVTQGIVSTVLRHDPQLAVYNDFIQTDAAINPGNSGGPLVNTAGELIGINTMIYSKTGGYQGIGFAIPSNLAQQIMQELRANGAIRRGSIGLDPGGLATMTRLLQDAYKLGTDKGVLIYNLPRASAAAAAGLQRGDIITKFNGTAIDKSDQLQRVIAGTPIDSTAVVEVVGIPGSGRAGTRTVSVPVKLMGPDGR